MGSHLWKMGSHFGKWVVIVNDVQGVPFPLDDAMFRVYPPQTLGMIFLKLNIDGPAHSSHSECFFVKLLS